MIYNELKQHGTVDFPIELYEIDKNHTRFEMASHWHTELEIIKIYTGKLNIKLNNHEYTACKNDVVFVNPETVHGAYPSDDCRYDCIVLNLGLLEIAENSCHFFIESILNREYSVLEFHKYTRSEFDNAIENLFYAMKHKSSGYKFTVIGALYRLFGIIIDSHIYTSSANTALINSDKNVPKLKNVLSFIRSNYDKQITLDDMAISAGMSPKYFCYFFKEMTRKTPVEYLTAYRIEKASRKLLNSDISVTDIAYSCGFNDLSYFIKTFKNLKGITPAKFRKYDV